MKKWLDELINMLVLCGSAGAYYFFSARLEVHTDPLALVCLIPAAWVIILMFLPTPSEIKSSFLELGGLTWSQADFVRGWLITGRTGSGKTAAAICNILEALFKNGKNWGGVCVDDKGLFFNILVKACQKYGQSDRLALLQVRPENAPSDWQPQYKYNLISDLAIPASSYAKTIVDVSKSIGGEGGNPFFITQAGIQIEKAIELFRLVDPKKCNLKSIYQFFSIEDDMTKILDFLAHKDESPAAVGLIEHFMLNYLKQPPDQRGGVKSTIQNCLSYFTQPDIAEVFCPEENSLDFSVIDEGIIISISLPNKFEIERRYINTFLKLAYYKHALRRFDKSEEQRSTDNLLVLIADEAQQIVTSAQSGTSDFNVIDKIREAKATGIYATQSTTSFVPAFGSLEKTKVFLLNLGNHVYFTVADADAAELAAKHIGMRTIQKMSRSSGPQGTTYSYTDQDEFCLKPFVLRNMKKFECVIVHCENGYRKTKLPTTDLTKPTEANYGQKSPESPRVERKAIEHADGHQDNEGSESDSPPLQQEQELCWPRSEIESSSISL